MILLNKLYRRKMLNSEGADLSRVVTEKLLTSCQNCEVDFNSIDKATAVFFQDFLFPLILEFGSETIKSRVHLLNLSDEIHLNYKEAFLKSSDYMDRIATRTTKTFGDISDLTYDLLIKAREISRRDPSAAHIIFGLGSGMIESLANMDIEQVRRVAASGVICFEPRFSTEFASKLAALQGDEVDVFLNVIGHIDMEGIYESEYH